MTVEQTEVIDIISIEEDRDQVVLTISDHLDWSDSKAHQITLQNKFNAYLAFVESGEIFLKYPKAKDKHVVFRVVFQNPPDEAGINFLNKAKQVIESAGFGVRNEVFNGSNRHSIQI
jgi:type IV secretory pathway VirJ component